MTIFWVIFGLLIVAGFVFIVLRLNAYSEMTYGYTPVNMENVLLAFIPWIIIIAGLYGENHGEIDSLALGIFFAFLAAIFIFKNVAKKTSVPIAIAAVVIAMILNILIFLAALGAEQRKNNYYYDD